MPGSSKVLKNRQQAKNRAEGIGDAQGRIVKEKAAMTMASCAICQIMLRMTLKNIEAQQHVSSKHPQATWDTCFPGQPDPAKAAAAAKASDAKPGPKPDLDLIRAQAAEARSVAEGGLTKEEKKKKKKKKEDLSFLDDAVAATKKK
jgi:hypothetical protein